MSKHSNGPWLNKTGMTVVVKGKNIDQAIRNLKRKVTQEGLQKDMRKMEFYEPGTVKRRRKAAEAKRRWDKKRRMTREELGI